MIFSSLKTTFVPLDENMTKIGVPWENNRKKWLITKIKRSFFFSKIKCIFNAFQISFAKLENGIDIEKIFFRHINFSKNIFDRLKRQRLSQAF